MELKKVRIEKPEDMNFILGHSHFIKTVEDIHEALVNTVPGIKFGMAFCEASMDRLVRTSGTDEELIKIAEKNAMAIGAGHSFIIFLKDCFPINVLHSIKRVPEVCTIHCATSNPTDVIVYETEDRCGIMGVVDGLKPLGVEGAEDVKKRKDFLRAIGYKL
jgi:hypothetical protein